MQCIRYRGFKEDIVENGKNGTGITREWEGGRWEGIERPYTADDVDRLRGWVRSTSPAGRWPPTPTWPGTCTLTRACIRPTACRTSSRGSTRRCRGLTRSTTQRAGTAPTGSH